MLKFAQIAVAVSLLSACGGESGEEQNPSGGAGGGGAPTTGGAPATGAPAAPGAASSSPPPSAVAPAGEVFSGVYEVPVPPALAAAARYTVAAFTWRVVAGVATLEYDLPMALVGRPLRVNFEGPFNAATQTATLVGPAGTAQCSRVGAEMRCHEVMKGIMPVKADLTVVAALASDYAGPPADRLAVTKLFSPDPIGIARVQLASPVPTPVDDKGKGKGKGKDKGNGKPAGG